MTNELIATIVETLKTTLEPLSHPDFRYSFGNQYADEIADKVRSTLNLIQKEQMTESEIKQLTKALDDSKHRINNLCELVNTYANALKLGDKVHAEDWSDCATNGLTLLQKIQNPT